MGECHFTSKLIGNKKDKLKSFMAIKLRTREPIFRAIKGN